jgi:hypothetical protein
LGAEKKRLGKIAVGWSRLIHRKDPCSGSGRGEKEMKRGMSKEGWGSEEEVRRGWDATLNTTSRLKLGSFLNQQWNSPTPLHDKQGWAASVSFVVLTVRHPTGEDPMICFFPQSPPIVALSGEVVVHSWSPPGESWNSS